MLPPDELMEKHYRNQKELSQASRGSSQPPQDEEWEKRVTAVKDTWLEPLLSAKRPSDFESLFNAMPNLAAISKYGRLLHECENAASEGADLTEPLEAIWAEVLR